MTDIKEQSQHNQNYFEFPEQITIKSDGNILKFVEILPAHKSREEPFAQYVFMESETNYGKTLTLSKSQVQKILSR